MGKRDTIEVTFFRYIMFLEIKSIWLVTWEGDGWNIEFLRTLGVEDTREWEWLVDLLDDFRLNDEHDNVEWFLNKSGRYKTHSMYRTLTFRGVTKKRMVKLFWGSQLPNKIKVFASMSIQDRLRTWVNLKKK